VTCTADYSVEYQVDKTVRAGTPTSVTATHNTMIRYDTIGEFNMDLKAEYLIRTHY